MSVSDKMAASDLEEKNVGSVHTQVVEPEGPGLQRQMKSRHIAMISIGGVIGTGLFVGTATALQNGGPIGLLLGYSAVGTICYCVMVTLGEMIAYLPIAGGHIKLAERFVDPAFSFALGWNFWYTWTFLLPTELSAASIVIGYWDKTTNAGVWITVCMVVTIAINLLGARAYGESEFIFSSIKVIAIVGLIILGIVLDLGGGPSHDRVGFRYWINPGPFAQYEDISGALGQFLGFWSVLTQAAFSFIGTEVVAIAAAEAQNPRHTLAKAVRRVYVRIILFYFGGTAVMGLLVPSNDSGLSLDDTSAAASPFVIAMKRAGIKTLPSIINACILTAAWSAASSDLYIGSRTVYGLATSGNAPRILLRVSRRGVPYVAVIFCALFACLAYMGINAGSGTVFNWFVNMTSVSGLLSWFGIAVTYLRFQKGLKVQGIDRKSLPYYTRLQPFAAWYTLVSVLIICFFSGWDVFLKGKWATDTFVTNYLPLAWFPALYIGAKIWKKCPLIAADEMDFKSGLDAIEADSYTPPAPKNKLEAFWQWLM